MRALILKNRLNSSVDISLELSTRKLLTEPTRWCVSEIGDIRG